MPNSIDINELKDLPEFKGLKPEELSLVNNILTEINSSGYSSMYESLRYADFNEIPVDIETFVDDYKYLGNAWHDALGNSKLYPYWRRELKKIFPNNLDTSVNNVILGGSRGRGKAQPMNAPIYARDGYIPMGNLAVGMEIYGSDGKLHKVSGIFPQGKKPVYSVKFSDKSRCLCTDEHLWKVRDGRSGHWNVIELKDIIKNRKLKSTQYFIPMTKPLEFDLQDTFLDSFYLGCVLGGRYCSSQLSSSSETPFPVSHVDAYIINSLEKRLSLLKGIFEVGDFKVDIQDGIRLRCKRDLLPKLKFLVQSLGGTLTATGNRRFNVLLRLDTSMYLNVLPDTYANSALKLPTPERYIEDIEYMGEEECQCIYIDSRDHLYLTEDLIVTHNTEIAVLCAAYILYRILCLKNPIEYFHLKPSEKIVFAFMNIKLDLAEEIGISKFQNTIQSSPWFLNHGEVVGRTHKIWVPEKFNDQDAIEIKIGSQSDDLIGQPVMFCFCDEISFIRNQSLDIQKKKANDILDTAIGGMKTRYIHKGKNPTLLILASSKRSDKSFLEEHMKKKLKSEKDNVYISEGPVWEVKPEGTYSDQTFRVALGNKFLQSLVIPESEDELTYIKKGYSIIRVPTDFKADFLDDIDRALCDFAGIASSSLSKYISGAAFCELIDNTRANPFSRDVIEVGNSPTDTAQYYDFFDITKVDPKYKSKPLYIHLDMSISGDKTGIAGVWITGKKPSTDSELQSRDLFYTLAFSVSIKAPKGWQISFEKNRNFIRWLKKKGFNIKGLSSDTFQSADLQQQLISEGYPCSIISVDRTDNNICKPYQLLKSTVYEKRLNIFQSTLLIQEVTELERDINTGKIDHPAEGSKDASDALCGALYNASQNAEQYAFDYGEDLDCILDLNQDGGDNKVREQLSINFNEEIQRMLDPVSRRQEELKKEAEELSKKGNPQPKAFGIEPTNIYKPAYLKDGIIVF